MGHPRELLALGDLHGQQELHLPAGLVQDVGHTVVPLGDGQGGVGDPGGVPGGRGVRALVDAHQLVDGDAAVHHVLAVVARVVPAAGHVERVVARGGGVAGDVRVALVGLDADVTGLASVAGGEFVEDLDAAALGVVEVQGVRGQGGVGVGGDAEGVAGLAVGGQGVALARPGEAAEVDGVHVLPGGLVQAVRHGVALGHDRALGVGQLPGQGLLGVGDHGGVLGALREVADLVDADARAGVGFVDRGFGAAEQRHVVQAERPVLLGPADLEGELGVGHLGRGGEDVLVAGRRRREHGPLVQFGAPGVDGFLDQRADGQAVGAGGGEREGVGLPGHEGDVVLADDLVPRVAGAAGDRDAQGSVVADGEVDPLGRPPAGGAVGEVAVGDLLDRFVVGLDGGGDEEARA